MSPKSHKHGTQSWETCGTPSPGLAELTQFLCGLSLARQGDLGTVCSVCSWDYQPLSSWPSCVSTATLRHEYGVNHGHLCKDERTDVWGFERLAHGPSARDSWNWDQSMVLSLLTCFLFTTLFMWVSYQCSPRLRFSRRRGERPKSKPDVTLLLGTLLI